MNSDHDLPPGFELVRCWPQGRLVLPTTAVSAHRQMVEERMRAEAAAERAEKEREVAAVEPKPRAGGHPSGTARERDQRPAWRAEPAPGWHCVLPDFEAVLEGLTEAAATARTGDREVRERLVAIGRQLSALGPDRIIAMPPTWRRDLAALESSLPHFSEPIRSLRHSLALAEATGTAPRIAPMLLLGPPGVGKSHFSQRVAELMGCQHALIAFDQPSAGTQLRGSDKYWSNSESGTLFKLICLGEQANPVILLDELDKSTREGGSRDLDPLAQLHGALEEQTARRLQDMSLDVEFDASLTTYIATANSLRGLQPSLLSRFEVFRIEAPTPSEATHLAREIARGVLDELGLLGRVRFERRGYAVLARLSPRSMQRVIRKLVAAAVYEGRESVSEQQVWDELGEEPAASALH